ncbi:MAG: radical SAM protein [Nanoarchaeota archaeon]|nr:radical SAM protein [Nanoarchaeota archaeon]
MEEKTSRVYKWLKGGKAYPFKVDLFLTNKCNLNCVFCNYPKKKPVKELDKKTIMSIAEESGRLGVKIIGILGGEPFTRKDVVIEFMAEIKKNGISGSIVTNGMLIDTEDIKKIIGMKWDLIRFSLDGSNSSIHDSLRGYKGSFDRVINVINHFNKLKEEFHANFPTIEINTVLCKKNLEDIENIIRLAHSLDIKRIYFLPMIEFVKGTNHLKIKKDDAKLVLNEIEKAEKIANTLGVSSNLDKIKQDYVFIKSNAIDA